MVDWITANRFDVDDVPTDARIEIRDGTCLGVELFLRDAEGRVRLKPGTYETIQRVEWHPMVQPPPPILLPEVVS